MQDLTRLVVLHEGAGSEKAAREQAARYGFDVQQLYSAALNGGNSAATDPTKRKMSKASETITYGLYRDSARSLPWGSTAGTDTVSGTGTGSNQLFTVYGRVAAQTTPSPGLYTDSVILTLTY